MAVNVYGPAGCGKSRNAETIRKRFGCKRVRDNVVPADLERDPVLGGDLLLSQKRLPGVRAVAFSSLGLKP